MKNIKIVLVIALSSVSFILFQNFTTLDAKLVSSSPKPTNSSVVTSVNVVEPLVFPNYPVIGANFNKSPENIRSVLLNRAEVKWVRASINMLPYIKYLKIKGKTNLSADEKDLKDMFDEQISSIQKVQNNDYKVILTLRWFFYDEKNPSGAKAIPKPGDLQEQDYFTAALDVINNLGVNSQIIVVGNEPTLETRPEDMALDAISNQVPMVQFYHRLARVVDARLRDFGRNKYKLLVGSFNRLDWPSYQEMPAVRRLFLIANESSFIDGVDVHGHVATMTALRNQLDFARKLLPSKMMIVTEFSLVRAFFRKLDVSVCNGIEEAVFCNKFGISNKTTREFVNETLTVTSDDKYTANLWNQFFKSRSYLPDDFLQEAYDSFVEYHVNVATYGLVNTNPNDIQNGYIEDEITSLPWDMNSIFVPATVSSGKVIRTNSYLYNTFMRLPKE